MVNMLGVLRYKAGSIQEPKRSVGDLKKPTVTEMKNGFDGLSNRLDIAEIRISGSKIDQ